MVPCKPQLELNRACVRIGIGLDNRVGAVKQVPQLTGGCEREHRVTPTDEREALIARNDIAGVDSRQVYHVPARYACVLEVGDDVVVTHTNSRFVERIEVESIAA